MLSDQVVQRNECTFRTVLVYEVFDAAGKLDKLENFTSLAGPRYYGLEPNEDTVTLVKGDPVDYPDHVDTADGPVTVFNPGFPLHWRVE